MVMVLGFLEVSKPLDWNSVWEVKRVMSEMSLLLGKSGSEGNSKGNLLNWGFQEKGYSFI